jgi:cell division protein FtsB
MIEAQYQLLEELRQEITEKDKEIEDLKREIMTYPDEEIEREERCGL